MSVIPFKQRVQNTIICCAADYKSVFLDYEYLLYSKSFSIQKYYTISAITGNYLHLTGVNSALEPHEFYEKCLNGSLSENDFDFIKPKVTESFVKGVVRSKIIALPLMSTLFSKSLVAQENITHGKVSCSFATTDNTITVGFANRLNARPKTLLRGNELNCTLAVDITLILRKPRGAREYDTILQGDEQELLQLLSKIIRKH